MAQQAMQGKDQVLANATFRIENMHGVAFFSDLGGISSEMEDIDYMEAGEKGAMFGRFLGKAKPPTVTLKRAMSAGKDTTWIWAWHRMARGGGTLSMTDTTMMLYGAGGPDSGPVATYILMNSFPKKVEIAGMKAGGTEVVIQTLTLQCDEIMEPPR